MMRELVARPAGQNLIAPAGPQAKSTSPTLDIKEGVLTTRRNLECVLLYAITQLAMWLSKPDGVTDSGGDLTDSSMDEDTQRRTADLVMSSSGSASTRGGRRSVRTMADRLKSGMTGEMASDLQSLLNKAKPVIGKSNEIAGLGGSVDLTNILSLFLTEHVIMQTQGAR